MLERILTFIKAQFSAFIGGVCDYLIMVFATEVLHIHYTKSIVIGGFIGAVINFSLNKKWTFRSKTRPYKYSVYIQMLKFVVVVVNSVFLKSFGTYLITNHLHLDYKISRIIVDLVVSIAFNYTLQRNWVFKKM